MSNFLCNLIIVILFFFAIWLVGVSIASFVVWHNYYTYSLSEWNDSARIIYLVFVIIGGMWSLATFKKGGL